MLFLVLALAGATSPVDEAEVAYALAYSSYVANACPGWEQHLEVLPAGFLPGPTTSGTVWAEGTKRQKAYREGGRDAAADRRKDDGFCGDPLRRRVKKAPQLRDLVVDRRGRVAP